MSRAVTPDTHTEYQFDEQLEPLLHVYLWSVTVAMTPTQQAPSGAFDSIPMLVGRPYLQLLTAEKLLQCIAGAQFS